MTMAVASLALVFVGLAFVGAALYGGIVLYILWGWFLVPLGLPQIGIAWAIGISCVAGLLTPTVPPAADKDARREHAINMLLKPAVLLVIGFVAKQFM